MDFSTRLLAVVAEIFIPPSDITDAQARDIFGKISDTHGVKSFITPDAGKFKISSGKRKPNIINYVITGDRISLAYEYCDNSLEHYTGRIQDFINVFSAATGINMFLMQHLIIRKLVNSPAIKDARLFMLNDMFSLREENLKCFDRPLHMAGARIFFPPVQGREPYSFDIKIESSLEDNRTMFVENKGMFPKASPAGTAPAEVKKNLELTESFITGNIQDFIRQFIKGGQK